MLECVCGGVVVHNPAPTKEVGGLIPMSANPSLEKCAWGICLCNLLHSTHPNDRETMIKG